VDHHRVPQTTPAAGLTEGYRAFGDDLRALAAPSDDLAQLAARLRAAAAAVGDQAVLHRDLLVLDWYGDAANAFRAQVQGHVVLLHRLAERLHDVADGAARQAAAGESLRATAGWAS
jgi:hypothetical protein